MFGLDDTIASLGDGTSLLLVALVATLLGLRHATDPDHVAAVTTLVASGRDRAAGRAARLGAAWGVGHGVALAGFGLPIVVYHAYLPAVLQRAAETLVGLMIVGLAAWLLVRWRRGLLHEHAHRHGADVHEHPHPLRTAHEHRGTRSPLGAFAIGLVHGVGGSAGVGVLVLASIDGTGTAVAALGVLALFTAVSMTLLTAGFGLTIDSRRLAASYARAAPVIGCASLAFGTWYALGALSVVPYLL
jgi:ABC-type nickel/cobalt efflux system permease component RcnA